jgi:hypothetical protein
MKRLLAAFILLGAIIIVHPADGGPVAHKPDVRCVLRIKSESDVIGLLGPRVQTAIGCGVNTKSGVFTAWHVVEDADRVFVIDYMGEIVQAGSWERVKKQDIAILNVDMSNLNVTTVSVAYEPLIGSVRVVCIGYWGAGHRAGAHVEIEGVIDTGAPKRYLMQDISFKTYASVFPFLQSMSGSPIFMGGKLVAICSSIPSDGFGDGYTFSARIDRELMDK